MCQGAQQYQALANVSGSVACLRGPPFLPPYLLAAASPLAAGPAVPESKQAAPGVEGGR